MTQLLQDLAHLTPQKTLGLIATSGALHRGHLCLIKASQRRCEKTLVSIFSSEKKPLSTIEMDLLFLQRLHVDFAFVPDKAFFETPFFPYTRLAHLVKLSLATHATELFIGEIDYELYEAARTFFSSFFIPTKVSVCPIVRETDGLVTAWNNALLSKAARKLAPSFSEVLAAPKPLGAVEQDLRALGFELESLYEKDGRRFGIVRIENIVLRDCVQLS